MPVVDSFDEMLSSSGAQRLVLDGDYLTTREQVLDLDLTARDLELAAIGLAASVARAAPGVGAQAAELALLARRYAIGLRRRCRAGASFDILERSALRLCELVEHLRHLAVEHDPATLARSGGASLLAYILDEEADLTSLELGRPAEQHEDMTPAGQEVMQAVSCRLHIAHGWVTSDVQPTFVDQPLLEIQSAIHCLREWRARHTWARRHLHTYQEKIAHAVTSDTWTRWPTVMHIGEEVEGEIQKLEALAEARIASTTNPSEAEALSALIVSTRRKLTRHVLPQLMSVHDLDIRWRLAGHGHPDQPQLELVRARLAEYALSRYHRTVASVRARLRERD